MSRKLTTQEFIDKSIATHGDKYSYSKSVYSGNKINVVITCHEHGDFQQMPSNHMRGAGCPSCALNESAKKQAMNTDSFVKKALAVHGNRFNYSLVRYERSSIKVEIVCRVHGSFMVTPNNHLHGKGCPQCAGRNKTSDSFRLEAAVRHNNKYDYSMVDYKGDRTKVDIICPEHGLFKMTPGNHLQGQKCPECSNVTRRETQRFTTDEFIDRAVSVHGDRYDYSRVNYVNYLTDIEVICKQHGSFMHKPAYHLAGNGCARCGMQMSKGEDEIFSIVASHCHDAIQSDRKIIAPYELDVYVPSRGIAIEFNGIHWHSDDMKDKRYHQNKFIACRDKGIRLISINDIEWKERKGQLTSIIISAIGARNDKAVNARQCSVCEVSTEDSREFLNKWHVQGDTTAKKVCIGLHTADGEIVAVMTFSRGANYRGAANFHGKEMPWSLSRFATSCNVRGGAGKLFKYAIARYDMRTVESFSMNNFFSGGLYEALGFEKAHDVDIDYQVYHPKCGLRPKSHWQRRMIPKRLEECGMQDLNFNPDRNIDSRTEFEIEDLCGAKRIWDTGKVLWRWNK